LTFKAPLKLKKLMTTNELLELIQSALMTNAAVTLDDTRTSVPDWDSVGHLSIISSLEASLGAKAIGNYWAYTHGVSRPH
jgi:hypothetical protein